MAKFLAGLLLGAALSAAAVLASGRVLDRCVVCGAAGAPSAVRVAFDAEGHVLSITDPQENRTEFEYVSDTSPRRDRERVLARDDLGRPTMIIDRAGWEVRMKRDEAGNVIEKMWVDPGDRIRSFFRCYGFDAEGRRVEEIDLLGRKKLIEYGEDGKICRVEAPPDFIEECDQAGFFNGGTRRSTEKSRAVTFTYDLNGRRTEKKEP